MPKHDWNYLHNADMTVSCKVCGAKLLEKTENEQCPGLRDANKTSVEGQFGEGPYHLWLRETMDNTVSCVKCGTKYDKEKRNNFCPASKLSEPVNVSIDNLNTAINDDAEVNHPSHYNSHPSGVECIDIVRHHNFAVGNAIKYLWRCGLKEGEDSLTALAKAKFYIEDEIARIKAERRK